jgi:hypothetical protein
MTSDDRKPFAAVMFGLGECFGEPVSEVRIELYFQALNDFTLDQVRQAARITVKASKFFPRPAELREAVTGPVDDRAELAWGAMRRLIRRFGFYLEPNVEDWPDDACRRAALELYGGWRALCSSLPADGPELLGFRKSFIGLYRAYEGRARHAEALPPGETGRELSAGEAIVAVSRFVRGKENKTS